MVPVIIIVLGANATVRLPGARVSEVGFKYCSYRWIAVSGLDDSHGFMRELVRSY